MNDHRPGGPGSAQQWGASPRPEPEPVLEEVARRLADYRLLESEVGESLPFGFEVARFRRPGLGPEEAAAAAREAAGLDPEAPVHYDLAGPLGRNGVTVLPVVRPWDEEQAPFYGLSVGPEDGGPAIAVNTWGGIAVERRLFTIARELAHLLLPPDRTGPPTGGAPRDEGLFEDLFEDGFADVFASAFLMPESAFEKAWAPSRGQPLVNRVIHLKRIYGIGYRTLLTRLVSTGRANPEVGCKFATEYGQQYDEPFVPAEPVTGGPAPHGRRNDEPFALSEFDYLPSRLPAVVWRAVRDARIRWDRGAGILGISPAEMQEQMRNWYPPGSFPEMPPLSEAPPPTAPALLA